MPQCGGRAADGASGLIFFRSEVEPGGLLLCGRVADDSIVPGEHGARSTNGREIESMLNRERPTLTETDVGL